MLNSFFIVINPSSGNTSFKKSWETITHFLKLKKINFSYSFTEYRKHEVILVDKAIKQGYRNIISVGGDGTLHHVVNGIMKQRYIKTSKIKLGVIPLGTGNDWIKTYGIPLSIKKSINIIISNKTIYQDIGYINMLDNKIEYFNNLAGIGYDGYIVNKLTSLKKIGSIAFLISGLYGLFFYKKKKYQIKINNISLNKKCLMILVGLCKYSGGGLRVTKNPNPLDGLLDITLVKNFSFFELLFNIPKLYNGKIVNHKKVSTFKTKKIIVKNISNNNSFIEADGEIIGINNFNISIIPQAIQFIIP
jgi:YegS/Rv2252/BmrU family lipid kinase